METVAVETASHMTDFEAVKVADLICDFFYKLRYELEGWRRWA
jgi:hypothetical protein